MRKLVKKIIYWLRFGKKTNRFKEYNSELLEGVLENRLEKRKLKTEIKTEVKRYLNVKANSQFIKRKRKNRAEIITFVNNKFGSRMKEQGIKINNDLTLCDI